MREEEKFLEKFIFTRGGTMTNDEQTRISFSVPFDPRRRVASFQTNPAIPVKTFPLEERRDEWNGCTPRTNRNRERGG